MFNMVGVVQGNFHRARGWAGEQAGVARNGMKVNVEHARQEVIHGYQTVKQGCVDTAHKTQDFILRNKETLFFVASCLITAYFSPGLFFSAAVITLICRIELTHYIKKFVDENWKPEKNMYSNNPLFGPNYVSRLELIISTIASIDALALGTIFFASSWSIVLLPALGGIAAGNCAAKVSMDIAHRLKRPII